jgi:hypothetical protein
MSGPSVTLDRTKPLRQRPSLLHWRDGYIPLVVCAVMLVPALWIAWCYRHQINPDGIAYLSIARKYAALEWHDAINAYWGPLYSWILAPFCAIGVHPHIAAKIIGLVTAFGGIFAIRFLCVSCALPAIAHWFACFSGAPAMLYFSVYRITPDLLLSVLLIVYLAAMMRPEWRTTRGGIWLGLLGGICYLTKAYGLFFFGAHFVLASVFLIWRDRRDKKARRRLRRFAIAGLAIFMLVCLPWIGALSHKYGRLMVSSTLEKNLQYNGPAVKQHWPMGTGFWTPPNPTAVSVWEDPTLIGLPDWNPLGSREELKYELRAIKRNTLDLVETFNRFSWLALPIIAVALVMLIARKGAYRDPTAWMLLTLAVYVGGYLPLHFQLRFLSFALLLVLPIATCALWSVRLPRWVRLTTLAIVGGSFWIWPIVELRNEITATPAGEREFQYARRLRNILPPTARIASDGMYYRSLYTAYFLDARFYGSPRAGESLEETQRHLRDNRVQYLFVWNDATPHPFLDPQREVARGAVPGLQIYQLE